MSYERDDARLSAALLRMSLDDLLSMQRALHAELYDHNLTAAALATAIGTHSIEVGVWLRFQRQSDQATRTIGLLGAVAVAIAWLTHRDVPATDHALQQALGTVREGRVYMLPVPRAEPCICGSRARFRNCHGRPPVAAPAM